MKDKPKAQSLQEFKELVLEKQKDIVSQIKEFKKVGKVKDYKQLWIINGIAVDADKEVIEALKARKDVAKVLTRESQQALIFTLFRPFLKHF